MHNSEELAEVAAILFKHLRELGGKLFKCDAVLSDSEIPQQWMSVSDTLMLPPFQIPQNLNKYLQNLYNAWKNRDELFYEVIEGENLKKHNKDLHTIPVIKALIDAHPEMVGNQPDLQVNAQLRLLYYRRTWYI
ncbi:hypothetical protein N9164_16805 [Draconibacterium sp.]|nr:hypothetical protein [Draconibacterium sp.]